jgi:hypothetical protein
MINEHGPAACPGKAKWEMSAGANTYDVALPTGPGLRSEHPRRISRHGLQPDRQ